VDITVLIPTIPGRRDQLDRAVLSAQRQTYPPARILLQLDQDREGAAATRNKALQQVDTEWVAFLDDDDELYPEHLKLCGRAAKLNHADVIYPGYDADQDPVGCFGLPFDGELLQHRNFIPVTTLCRTEAVLEAGGFQAHPDENGDPCEDWGLWLAMAERGARFVHLPVRTWRWNNGNMTTRGRPDRW
jgi:glycosyltransferase involved in cell wall biosynthesis